MIKMDVIGHTAGVLTTLSFLPQIFKLYQTNSADDISIPMYIIFLTGVTLWTIYGYLKNAMPVLVFNFVTGVLVLTVLLKTIQLRRAKKKLNKLQIVVRKFH